MAKRRLVFYLDPETEEQVKFAKNIYIDILERVLKNAEMVDDNV